MKAIWTEDEASYTGSSCTSTGSGPGPSPPSGPTRRCSSAATARPSSRPRAGVRRRLVPQLAATGVLERMAALRAARRPADRREVMGLHADAACDRDVASRPAAGGVVHWIPSGNRSVVERGFERWEAAIAEVDGRGGLRLSAMRRLASGSRRRGWRGWRTADAEGRPHLVPVVFAVDGDRVYTVVDAKPKRTTALRRLRNVRREPARRRCSSTTTTTTGSALWWVRAEGTRARARRPSQIRGGACGRRCCGRAIPQQRAMGAVLAVDVDALERLGRRRGVAAGRRQRRARAAPGPRARPLVALRPLQQRLEREHARRRSRRAGRRAGRSARAWWRS